MSWIHTSIAAAAMIGSGFVVAPLSSQTSVNTARNGLDVHETHASASLLGQFRTSASAWLWLRTDLYLHNGVEMRRTTQQEQNQHGHHEHDEHHEHGDGGNEDSECVMHEGVELVTAIPPPESDFRGILGDLERATAPYKDMRHHSHNDPQTALPLFRLMTWIDPSFILGWTTGAAVIARGQTDEAVQMSLDFLLAGLQSNPKSFEILQSIGQIYCVRRRDFSTAQSYLEQACEFGESAANSRPLSDDEAEALSNAFRWLAMSYRETADVDKLQAATQRGLALFPEDQVLLRLRSRMQ